MLIVPRRSLVLVAGIPGAGKSTLLRELRACMLAPTVLDADPLRERLRAMLPAGTGYRVYRPLVHLWHRLRIVVALFVATGPVVVHLPATGAVTRCVAVVLAILACRQRYLIWVDVDPPLARAGQRCRGRVLTPSSFARHARLGTAFALRLRDGHRPPGWRRVTVVDRRQLRLGFVLAGASVPWPALPGH